MHQFRAVNIETMLISGIIGAAAGLGSSILSAIQSKKNNDNAQRILDDRKAENEAWYKSRMGRDYTMRSDAQAVFNKQKELLQQQYNNARAANIVAGGTDESLAMQTQAANNSLAQTMSGIAADAASYRDQVESQYEAKNDALAQQQANIYSKQAEANAAAGAQAVNSSLNLIGKLGNIDKKKA